MKIQLNVNVAALVLLLLIVLLLWWLCSDAPDEPTADGRTLQFPPAGEWGQGRAS